MGSLSSGFSTNTSLAPEANICLWLRKNLGMRGGACTVSERLRGWKLYVKQHRRHPGWIIEDIRPSASCCSSWNTKAPRMFSAPGSGSAATDQHMALTHLHTPTHTYTHQRRFA